VPVSLLRKGLGAGVVAVTKSYLSRLLPQTALVGFCLWCASPLLSLETWLIFVFMSLVSKNFASIVVEAGRSILGDDFSAAGGERVARGMLGGGGTRCFFNLKNIVVRRCSSWFDTPRLEGYKEPSLLNPGVGTKRFQGATLGNPPT